MSRDRWDDMADDHMAEQETLRKLRRRAPIYQVKRPEPLIPAHRWPEAKPVYAEDDEVSKDRG